jgi:hypothetical protein
MRQKEVEIGMGHLRERGVLYQLFAKVAKQAT